jgi:hypothetical protein
MSKSKTKGGLLLMLLGYSSRQRNKNKYTSLNQNQEKKKRHKIATKGCNINGKQEASKKHP